VSVNQLHKSLVLLSGDNKIGLLNLFSKTVFNVTDTCVKIHAYHLKI
jgi:hypothetical protein